MVCWSCSLKEGWLICRSRFKLEPAGLIFGQSNVFLYMNPCSSPPKWKGYWHILWGLTSALLSEGDWVPMGSPRAFTGGWPASQPAPSIDWVPASMSSDVFQTTQPWALTQGCQALITLTSSGKRGRDRPYCYTLFIEFNGIQLCRGLTSCPWGISKNFYVLYLFILFISFTYYWTMNSKNA